MGFDVDPRISDHGSDFIIANSSGSPTPRSDQSHDPNGRLTKRRKLCDESLIPLNRYIPIGCLRFCANENVLQEETCDWIECTGSLPAAQSIDFIKADLKILTKSSWVRVFSRNTTDKSTWILRIYLLPDDALKGMVNRDARPVRKSLEKLLPHLYVSRSIWEGQPLAEDDEKFDVWATADNRSLFYLFNTLSSPDPMTEKVSNRHAKLAIHSLLDPDEFLPGLTTSLYPYQRRSAATMLQREVSPGMQLDPRLEMRTSPTSMKYYYAPRTRTFYKDGPCYESVRGGILAETMGLGKTLICIALILSTKGHLPLDPPLYATPKPTRSKVGSLMDMAASAIQRYNIPWRPMLDEVEIQNGDDMAECRKAMERIVPNYEIPPRIIRSHRNIHMPPSRFILKCRGTVIVVPRNLIYQWRSEFLKHAEDDALKILFMDDLKSNLPDSTSLSQYDVILFSRERFEREHPDDKADSYVSPLNFIHWLRIIIDEGHSFSSHNSRAVRVANNIIRADRRWIVSGTPAKDLLGIEVDLAIMTDSTMQDDAHAFRTKSLQYRKSFNSQDESNGAVKSLGVLARYFLKAQPWEDPDPDCQEKFVAWDDEIYRHEDLQKRTYTCFSTCLRRTLESLVIKTQPQDVERDILLPPLTHEIVRLEPSFYDKITANLFVLLLTTNAVASERTDVDYLFHPTSQGQLHRLIANLRQSGFNWTGLNASIVQASLDEAEKYLSKENTKASPEDRHLLVEAAEAARIAMCSLGWHKLTDHQEMGFFLDDWPEESVAEWSFTSGRQPAMTGLSQARQAQNYINSRLSDENPSEGLKTAGILAMAALDRELLETRQKINGQDKQMVKTGVPSSAVENASPVTKRFSVSTGAKVSPKKPRAVPTGSLQLEETPTSPQYLKRSEPLHPVVLSREHLLSRTQIIGTSSTKLSHLLDRISAIHTTEKTLVFYSGDHIAYYISQALDVLHITHLVYTSALSAATRAKYVVLFDTDIRTRVLLMDINQASHGLNASSASRVFFVNPPCRPNIVAQAIKRAHRIGQTRPVHVETLVLKGTIEEAMHDRASGMTRHEHLAAKTLEDDGGIARIIQAARVMPVSPTECTGYGQVARLAVPQQLWGRSGREKGEVGELERELFPDGVEGRTRKRAKKSPAKNGASVAIELNLPSTPMHSISSFLVASPSSWNSAADTTSAAMASHGTGLAEHSVDNMVVDPASPLADRSNWY